MLQLTCTHISSIVTYYSTPASPFPLLHRLQVLQREQRQVQQRREKVKSFPDELEMQWAAACSRAASLSQVWHTESSMHRHYHFSHRTGGRMNTDEPLSPPHASLSSFSERLSLSAAAVTEWHFLFWHKQQCREPATFQPLLVCSSLLWNTAHAENYIIFRIIHTDGWMEPLFSSQEENASTWHI